MQIFLPLSLSAPPLACSTPGAESNSVERQKIILRPLAVILPHLNLLLPYLIFLSTPAKINPGHATAYNSKARMSKGFLVY